MGSLFAFVLPDWHFTWGFRWRDVLDVALMTFFIYQAAIRFRGTRAARIGAGLAVLGVFYFLAQAAGLFLTTWVLGGISLSPSPAPVSRWHKNAVGFFLFLNGATRSNHC